MLEAVYFFFSPNDGGRSECVYKFTLGALNDGIIGVAVKVCLVLCTKRTECFDNGCGSKLCGDEVVLALAWIRQVSMPASRYSFKVVSARC